MPAAPGQHSLPAVPPLNHFSPSRHRSPGESASSHLIAPTRGEMAAYRLNPAVYNTADQPPADARGDRAVLFPAQGGNAFSIHARRVASLAAHCRREAGVPSVLARQGVPIRRGTGILPVNLHGQDGHATKDRPPGRRGRGRGSTPENPVAGIHDTRRKRTCQLIVKVPGSS